MLKIKNLKQVLIHIVLIAFVIAAIIPFLNMITVSLIPDSFILPSKPQIIPKIIDFSNYIDVFKRESFFRYFLNSLFITCISTVLIIIVASLSGYGFSRLKFPGKNIIFNIYVISLMVPAILAIVSQFTLINKIGLYDTYTGLIALYISGGVAGYTFFLKGFFDTIPRELEESVIMDGGSKWTIYRHIIIPLSKPAIGTMAIQAFTGIWMEIFTALIILKSESKRTLPIALKLLQNGHATQWGVIFAAAIVILIPIIIIFITFNKQFIKRSGSEGAIKG